jgi:aldehyde dehydrogenase family 7 protein A1
VTAAPAAAAYHATPARGIKTPVGTGSPAAPITPPKYEAGHLDLLRRLSLEHVNDGVFNGRWSGNRDPAALLHSLNPATGGRIASVRPGTVADLSETLDLLQDAKRHLTAMPMPKRGELVRAIRVSLAERKEDLGRLVSLEVGKILPEGLGEVQEFVDVCDYAVGLSRTIGGAVLPSERPGHAMMEVWNPLGVVGVISAFNFPVAGGCARAAAV